MKEEIRESDVLIIGGGIAGLMAAIRAGELGVKVILVEKANTLRSGAGATGNDHFMCYIPEYHGPDIEPWVDASPMIQEKGNIRSRQYVRTLLEKSAEIVKLWDSWGISMKPTGKWECTGHTIPGMSNISTLKYAGQNQKIVLTREAKKRGVEIINRVTVFALLKDEYGVFGAIAAGTREETITIFKANSVVLATGICTRLYPGPTPAWPFNIADPPSTTGEGRAMAYRAGAELVNMEMPRRWAGPRYFARCGKGTWIGVIRNAADNPVGPYVTEPDKRYGDVIGDQYPSLFEERMKDGSGPVYMDCRGTSEEAYDYMMWGLGNEGNTATIKHLKEEGIDVRKHPVEFMTYELSTRGGILFNEKGETNVNGLFAAGDEYFGGIGGAAVGGWLAGDNAVLMASSTKLHFTGRIATRMEEIKALPVKIRERETCVSWQEVSAALNQIMLDYAGPVRSETLLRAGLNHLLRIKQKAYNEIAAKNQHELMHCLEVLNSFDIGQLVFLSALERKETRDEYIRSDYPFKNSQYNNKVVICREVDGKPHVEWRKIN